MQQCALVIDGRTSNLRQKPDTIGLWQSYVLQSFITVRANRAQIVRCDCTAFRFFLPCERAEIVDGIGAG